ACVSLLLEVLRGCKGSVRLTGIPESVRALSELYEIKDWLKS
ncbi:sulfate transporter, partial [Neisseria meningitidis]|nr:sulfate transporter [Neisseria meningitidis]